MKERPILFSGPMVRALLAGTKTQTRRVCKPARDQALSYVVAIPDTAMWGDEEGLATSFACPYGRPGDRLWVRETWRVFGGREYEYQQLASAVQYRADEVGFEQKDWRPSIFMPRWASRITLEVTGARVERLNDISEADAVAEGIPPFPTSPSNIPRMHYATLWNSINGAGSWDANPWVWAISFKRVAQ